jgi:hypothetical protein
MGWAAFGLGQRAEGFGFGFWLVLGMVARIASRLGVSNTLGYPFAVGRVVRRYFAWCSGRNGVGRARTVSWCLVGCAVHCSDRVGVAGSVPTSGEDCWACFFGSGIFLCAGVGISLQISPSSQQLLLERLMAG